MIDSAMSAETPGIESSVDWQLLPDHLWARIFYSIPCKGRAIVELVCRKFYSLIFYDDMSISCRDASFVDKFFHAIENKRESKIVKFKKVHMMNPSEAMLNMACFEYSIADLSLDLFYKCLTNEAELFQVYHLNFANGVCLFLTKLRIDSFVEFPLSNVNLEFHNCFPNLKTFIICNSSWCPTKMPANLRHLSIAETPLFETLEDMLAGCLKLSCLKLRWDNIIIRQCIKLPLLPRLNKIVFSNTKALGVTRLLKRGGIACPALDALHIGHTTLDNNCVIPALRKLRILRLGAVKHGDILNFLNNACPDDLIELYLEIGSGVTDKTFDILAFRFNKLQTVSVRTNDKQFTAVHLRDFITNSPDLVQLNLHLVSPHDSLVLTGLVHLPSTVRCSVQIYAYNISVRTMSELLDECTRLEKETRLPSRVHPIKITLKLESCQPSTLRTMFTKKLQKYSFLVEFIGTGTGNGAINEEMWIPPEY